MSDLEEVVSKARQKMRVEQDARTRFTMGASASGIRKNRYERIHRYFAPPDGDQWPEDLQVRPGKLHITANLIRSFCVTEARVLSIPPRVTNKPPTMSPEDSMQSEILEEYFHRLLDMSGWDVWMFDRELMGSLYGKKILKPFWNADTEQPDVQLVEQPQNLMLGYGSSDYNIVDWAIYRYSISGLEAKMRWPDIDIKTEKGKPPVVSFRGGDHTDPLEQKAETGFASALSSMAAVINRIGSTQTDGEYEQAQIEIWDYWYRREGDGVICNAILAQGVLADGPHEHTELPAVPYIVTEHDHEPGSPEGLGTAEQLIDTQMGVNRALSHYAQLVADNSGTAYQLTGDNADTVPENVVPKEDEIVPAGSGNTILPINRGVNVFNFEQLIAAYWDTAHKITGLPEVMFGAIPGTQTSGRAMAAQIEAAQNRLDPKRRRSYEGLRILLLFWGYMLKEKNPTVAATERIEAEEGALAAPSVGRREIKIGDLLEGFENWKIIAPEITPRDAIEHTQNIINQVNAKLVSLEKGMDELGIENPRQMLAQIEAERSNASLFPGDAQAKIATSLLALQVEQAEAQQAMQQAGATESALQQDAQEAQPRGFEDMNQPMTQAGMAPPPGAPAPGGGELQPMIRQTPEGESQAMSQIVLPRTGLGL